MVARWSHNPETKFESSVRNQRNDAQMRKFNFEYCMKHSCNGCKLQRGCGENNIETKNKNFIKRIKQERKECASHINMLYKNR